MWFMQKKVILVGGCFDILHVGHIYFLKKAKSFGNYLVVLLEPDENIKKLKGKNRPIFKLKDRIKVLEAIKYVDKIIVTPPFADDNTYFEIIKKIKPSVICITEGDKLGEHKRKQAKIIGAKFKVTKKYKNLSTTKLISKFDLI